MWNVNNHSVKSLLSNHEMKCAKPPAQHLAHSESSKSGHRGRGEAWGGQSRFPPNTRVLPPLYRGIPYQLNVTRSQAAMSPSPAAHCLRPGGRGGLCPWDQLSNWGNASPENRKAGFHFHIALQRVSAQPARAGWEPRPRQSFAFYLCYFLSSHAALCG